MVFRLHWYQRNCTYLYLYNVRDMGFCLKMYVIIEQHSSIRVLTSHNRIQLNTCTTNEAMLYGAFRMRFLYLSNRSFQKTNCLLLRLQHFWHTDYNKLKCKVEYDMWMFSFTIYRQTTTERKERLGVRTAFSGKWCSFITVHSYYKSFSETQIHNQIEINNHILLCIVFQCE